MEVPATISLYDKEDRMDARQVDPATKITPFALNKPTYHPPATHTVHTKSPQDTDPIISVVAGNVCQDQVRLALSLVAMHTRIMHIGQNNK